MNIWIVMMLPVAPLVIAGLWTEEALLLAVSGLKAAYNVAAYRASQWATRRAALGPRRALSA